MYKFVVYTCLRGIEQHFWDGAHSIDIRNNEKKNGLYCVLLLISELSEVDPGGGGGGGGGGEAGYFFGKIPPS